MINVLYQHIDEKCPEHELHLNERCPECGSHCITDFEKGEIVCAKCGLVIDENIIDPGPEWRAFDFEKRARTGAPMTLTIHDRGLSTEISRQNRDASGRLIPNKNKFQIDRLRKWHQRTRIRNAKEKSYAYAFGELARIISSLKLPKNMEEIGAAKYREIAEKDLIRGRSIDAVAATTIYIVCRQHGIPRSLDEIAVVAKVGRKEISSAYRAINRGLELKLELISPKDYVPRFSSNLSLDEEVGLKAVGILEQAEQEGSTNDGKSPAGGAAAAIYIAVVIYNKATTQREIAIVADVTEVTIRSRYKAMIEKSPTIKEEYNKAVKEKKKK